MVRVLFICMGNICRSPMAEGTFRHLARHKGLPATKSGIETDSAGTSHYHVGDPPDRRAVATMRDQGMNIAGLRARQAVARDFHEFDYLIAMDRDNLHHMERLAPEGLEDRLSLLLDDARGIPLDEVPDPYYGGDEGFSRCRQLIATACEGLLERIIMQHFPDHDARPQG